MGEIGESEKAEESEVSTDREEKEMTGGIKIVSEQNLGSYVTLHPTNTTNTFTPTTLKTIEQMFVDVEEPESYKNQAGFAPPTLEHKTYINMDSSNWQQGGVTTVVTPSAAPPPSFELLQPSSQEEDEEGEEQVGGGAMPQEESRPDGEPAGRGQPGGGRGTSWRRRDAARGESTRRRACRTRSTCGRGRRRPCRSRSSSCRRRRTSWSSSWRRTSLCAAGSPPRAPLM